MRHGRPGAAARDRAPAPEERSLTEPHYVGSFPRADAPFDPPLPEIAFVGRSNVGKSSLLNALVGTRIAKVSGTPGKTRMMNVFAIPGPATVGAQDVVGARHAAPLQVGPVYLLDLPGYGYSRASKADRVGFRRLVHHVLRRERLTGVVWLLDIRHEPSAGDLTMQDLLAERETRVLAALTKGDQVSRELARDRAQKLRATLALPEDQIIVTSTRTGEGVEELREAIGALITKATE